MARILVVEDEIDICNLITKELEAEGHEVHQALDGLTALSLVESASPQLIILDWMLPKLDGLSVCRRVRQKHLIPIIMLTARTEEVDRILGLEVGADDYIGKPFSVRELTARVRAMLRRVEMDRQLLAFTSPLSSPSQPMTSPDEYIERGTLKINLTEHTVTLENTLLDLTPREYDLLVLLASQPGRAFSRDYMLQKLWGYDYDGFDRTVDTHMTRLRKKLGNMGEKIVTVWGVGYRFTL